LVPAQALQVLDDTEAIKQAVIAGHGLSCLPKLAIQAELRQHRLVVVGATFLKLERQLWRVTRRDSRSGPLLRAFEQAVERSLSTTDK
jgi:DNA-binding transcriptional LysR family regulator